MRRALLIASLLFVPTAAAEAVVSFGVPAQFEGDVGVRGEWVLVYFSDATADFSMQLQDARHTNHTMGWYVARSTAPVVGELQHRNNDLAVARDGGSWEELETAVAFRDGWSSLFVVADHLELTLDSARGQIITTDGDVAEGYLPTGEDAPPFVSRGQNHVADGSIVFSALAPAMPLRLDAWGVRHVEWHNATTTCLQSCPDGARSVQQRVQQGATTVHVERLHYAEITSTTGALHGAGTAYLAVMGGPSMDAWVDGSLRLPAAHASDCDCLDPAGSTLAAQGNLTISGMHMDGAGRITGSFGGSVVALRFDEAGVENSWLTGDVTVVVVAAAAFVLVVPLLWSLFTRVAGDKVLDHPTRRRIHAFVASHAGATFHDIARGLGISSGGLNYHLKVMLHQGAVTAYPFLNRSYHFVRRHDPGASWQQWILSRDSDHGWIQAWIAAHPGATQTEIARHVAQQGVGRTALQKRLDRLVAAGLVHAERVGRVVQYQTATRQRDTRARHAMKAVAKRAAWAMRATT